MTAVAKKSSGRLPILGCVLREGATPLPGHRLIRKRGQGGFSEVWEAEDPSMTRIALKFLPCRNSSMVVQELRNLQALRDIKHPHILGYDRIWSHAGYIIVAMQLADGNLEDLLEIYQSEVNTPIAAQHACLLLTQAAQGIDFLHTGNLKRPGFQHCDIKPSNLLLFGETVKVADFGLVSQQNASMDTRSLGGTPDYCAPEVFRGRVSVNTDQFALAVSYCQLRGGRFPFRERLTSLMEPCVRSSPDLSMLASEERPIIARALDSTPGNRWSSCVGLMRQLTDVIQARNAPITVPAS